MYINHHQSLYIVLQSFTCTSCKAGIPTIAFQICKIATAPRLPRAVATSGEKDWKRSTRLWVECWNGLDLSEANDPRQRQNLCDGWPLDARCPLTNIGLCIAWFRMCVRWKSNQQLWDVFLSGPRRLELQDCKAPCLDQASSLGPVLY